MNLNGGNNNGRDRTFLRLIMVLATVMILFGVATMILAAAGEPSDKVIYRLISGFGAMFTGMIGLALGYLYGASEMAAKLAVWGSVAVAVLALLGGVFSIGQTLGHIEDQLDRNCRALASIKGHNRFLILEHVDMRLARDLRRTYVDTAEEACG